MRNSTPSRNCEKKSFPLIAHGSCSKRLQSSDSYTEHSLLPRRLIGLSSDSLPLKSRIALFFPLSLPPHPFAFPLPQTDAHNSLSCPLHIRSYTRCQGNHSDTLNLNSVNHHHQPPLLPLNQQPLRVVLLVRILGRGRV